MDVRCSRCGTEYDFDDALVSERGTTVKCTNCGHQFKVFPGGAGGAPERWVVRKSSGRELVYTSLRDLQRAIAQRQVGPHDFLSRGGSQPLRALGSIAELEPFFIAQGPAPGVAGAAAAPPAAGENAQRTLLGLSPGSSASRAEDTVPDQPPLDEPTTISRGRGPAPAPSARVNTPVAPPLRREDVEPKTLPRNPPPGASTHEPGSPPTLGSVPPGYGQGPSVTASDPMGRAFRASQDSFSDEPLPIPGAPRRTTAIRWVVGLVLLGVLAFVGGTVGVRYAKSLRTAPTPASAAPDDRVKKFLDQSETELSRGDYESAKEQLDKASALAEKDVSVLSALARLEATRADVHWLSIRLLEEKNTQELESVRSELAQRVDRVKRATASAVAVAADDKGVMRVRIDALRIAGDIAGARALVGALGLDASQPETAYVLGALDLAEVAPTFGAAADRLRAGASTERGFGRARAALVYALASSGSLDEANAELLKLDSAASGHPLVTRLKSFLARKAGEAPVAASALPPEAAPSGSAAGSPAPPSAAVQGVSPTPAGEAIPRGTDFRKLLEDASAAKRNGDLGRAEALYRAAQSQQPGNVEALAGLGDVARMRGDSATATGYYESVLQQNPTYLPALIAAADLKWQNGDRAAALSLYKRVANQTDPGSSYGQKAAARIAEAQGSGASGGGDPRPGKEAPAPEPAPAEKKPDPAPTPEQPHIDTSDLPGFP